MSFFDDEKNEPSSGIFLKFPASGTLRVRLMGDPVSFMKAFGDQEPTQRFGAVVLNITGKGGKRVAEPALFEFSGPICRALFALHRNEDWGDPTGYDVTITRTGEGLQSKYTVMPSPKSPISDEDKTAVEISKLTTEMFFKKAARIPGGAEGPDDDYPLPEDE